MKLKPVTRRIKGALLIVLLSFLSLFSSLSAEEKGSDFLVDINLVDQSISFFLEDTPLSSGFMDIFDRNGDREFDMFDVDLSINDFIQPLNKKLKVCEEAKDCGDLYEIEWQCSEISERDANKYCKECIKDDDCKIDGEPGRYCSDFRCVRSCGNAGSGNNMTLRECHGRNKACDLDYGKCYTVENPRTTCQTNSDCLSGNYCYMGTCEPLCYSSTDCPGADWICSDENRCIPKESGNSDETVDPEKFQIVFGKTFFKLDTAMPYADIPITVMDKKSKKQAIGIDALFIPYRLKVTYNPRKSSDCPDKERYSKKECRVEPFLIAEKPIGIVTADAGQRVRFKVDDYMMSILENGYYSIDVELTAGNGNRTYSTIVYDNPSISGKYSGIITLNEPAYSGNIHMGMELYIHDDETVQWDKLLKGEEDVDVALSSGLPIEESFSGNLVHGYILKEESPIHFEADSSSGSDVKLKEKVPFVGIYQKESGSVRMIFEINMHKNLYWNGGKTSAYAAGMSDPISLNNFGRNMRKLILMDGKIDSRLRTFRGIYRETFSEMNGASYTVGGNFSYVQKSSAASVPKITDNPEFKVGKGSYNPSADNFSWRDYCPHTISDSDLETALANFHALKVFNMEGKNCDGEDECAEGYSCENSKCKRDSNIYMDNFEESERVLFPGMVNIENRLSTVIASIEQDDTTTQKALLEKLHQSAKICGQDDKDSDTCIDVDKMVCALQFYGKAIREAKIDPSDVSTHSEISRKERFALTQRFTSLLNQILQTYNYAAQDYISQSFLKFFNTDENFTIEDDLEYTLKAFKMHADARKVLFDSHIQKSVRNLVPVPYWINDDKGQRYESEFGSGNVQTFLDRMIGQMESSADVLYRYFDIKRRFGNVDMKTENRFLSFFGNQLYLEAATVLSLHENFEGTDSLTHIDYIHSILGKIQDLRLKLDEQRNPLGYEKDQMFFSFINFSLSDGSNIPNYKKFYNELQQKVGETKIKFNEAIAAFRTEFNLNNDFDNQLKQTTRHYEDEIDLICGKEDIYVELPCADRENLTENDLGYVCQTDSCDKVVATFNSKESGSISCRPDIDPFFITFNGEKRGCYNSGQIMNIINDVEVQKKQLSEVETRLSTLMMQLDIEREFISELSKKNSIIVEDYNTKTAEYKSNSDDLRKWHLWKERAHTVASGIPQIGGVSVDYGSPLRAAANLVANEFINPQITEAEKEQAALHRAEQLEMMTHGHEREMSEREKHIALMLVEAYNLSAQHSTLRRQIMSHKYRIQQMQMKAQEFALRWEEDNRDLIDYLIDNPQNSRFQKNKAVMNAEEAYGEALDIAYQFAKAVEYEYNWPLVGELGKKVFKLRTIDSLIDFADNIEALVKGNGKDGYRFNYSENLNGSTIISIRKHLFPHLSDRVDPETNEIISEGEQFHSLITSAKYRFLRPDPNKDDSLIERLEIPFSIWLRQYIDNQFEINNGYIDPETCNSHILSIEIITEGQNISSYKYGLKRSNMDDMRTCFKTPESDAIEVQRWKVGSPNWNYEEVENNCLNTHFSQNPNPSCTNTVFKDRSVASDYKLIFRKSASDKNGPFFFSLDKPKEYCANYVNVPEDGECRDYLPKIYDIKLKINYRYRPVSQNTTWPSVND